MAWGYEPGRWGPEVLMGDAPPRLFSEAIGRREEVGLSGKLPVLTSPSPVQEDQIQAVQDGKFARECWHRRDEGRMPAPAACIVPCL